MEEMDFYTKGEEIANAITHGVGAILSLAGAIALIIYSALTRDVYRIVSFTIYGTSLVTLYLGSTLYHSIPNKKAKKVFRVIDHSSIYVLIAGSYTPFILMDLRASKPALIVLIVIWMLTLIGIVFKSICINKFEKLSTWLYILMGWAVLFIIKDVIAAVPVKSILLLAIGGVVYTVGCIFFVKDEWPYNHAIWHLFVLVGSILQYFSIILYL